MKVVLSGPIKDDAAWEKFVRGAFTMIDAEGQAALNEMFALLRDQEEGK